MTTLRYLTAGESHGEGLIVIIEGIPAGLKLTADQINKQLSRRQKGYGRGGRMRIESDKVNITAGIRYGITLGSPISFWIENRDWGNWKEIMSPGAADNSKKGIVECPRPGHADLAGGLKYNTKELRNILERASARETTARVAAGATARIFLEEFGIEIGGHVTCIGGITIADERPSFKEIIKRSEKSEVRCINEKISKKMMKKIDEAKNNGDSVGGIYEVIVDGAPAGLGSHVQYDRKLDGCIAAAVMSIQATKGVEIGMGFKEAFCLGSEAHDEIYYKSDEKRFFHKTNRCGGLTGGITNGEQIIVRGVMKPIATLMKPLHSVNIQTKKDTKASVERSDTCAVPASSVIAENVVAFEIARVFLEKFGGDSMDEIKRNYNGYLEQMKSY